MGSQVPDNAYATLITRSSYLAGVILLAHSLKKHRTKFPLVVLYTPNLPSLAVEALKLVSKHSRIIPIKVKPLKLGGDQETYLIAARFADTWTKLQVFSEPMHKYNQVCYLDADMLIFNENMDCVFEAVQLPGDDWLGATQACCCKLDHDAWAPAGYVPGNCPYTPLKHPDALT
jgi:inositol 3-alpha-galactosyltransferase